MKLFDDKDAAVRWWAAVGCTALGSKAAPAAEALRKALADPSPVVRVAAAEALCKQDRHTEALPVLIEALKHENDWVRHSTALVLDSLGEKARPALEAMKARVNDPNQYVGRVLGPVVKRLGG
jgi:HEAT repeat protein